MSDLYCSVKDDFMQNFEQKLIENIYNYSPDFPLEALLSGLSYFERRQYAANSLILKAGENADFLFIAEKSISRMYSDLPDGNEKTVWLEPEMKFLTDYESYYLQIPSKYNIQLYEETEVFYITKENWEKLYKSFHDWAYFGIRIMETYVHYIFSITSGIIANSATENYELLLEKYPRFFHVVPLKHMASRLNVSPVTISRIRSNIANG